MANYPVPTEPQEGFRKPVSYKGYTQGTFGVTYDKTTPAKPAIFGVPKVGGEIRNLEMEELIRLGRLAKKEGFSFDVDTDGVVTGVEIPKVWSGDEDILRLELAQQKTEADIFKELIPLSLIFSENNKEANLLKSKIQDPGILVLIERLAKELTALIKAVYTKPTRIELDEISQKLPEFEKAVESARNEIANIPTPATTPGDQGGLELQKELTNMAGEVGQELTKAPSLERQIVDKNNQDLFIEMTRNLQDAFTSLKHDTTSGAFNAFLVQLNDYKQATKQIEIEIAYRAANPAVQPKPLDVSSTWPPYIYFDKSKGKNGWFFSLNDHRNPDHLPGDQWSIAEANIKPVFAEYLTFMQEGSLKGRTKKVELFTDLINAKNAVIEALKNKDPEQALALAEALRKTIEEKKDEWKKFTEEEIKIGARDQEKVAAKKRHDVQIKNLENVKDYVNQIKAWQLTATEVGALDVATKNAENAYTVAKIAFDGSGPIKTSLLDDVDTETERLSSLSHTLDTEYTSKNKTKGGTLLRPSYLKKVEGDDIRKIDVRGGGQITVNEWLAKEETRKSSLESKQREEKLASKNTIQKLYEDAMEKNPSRFLSLYTDIRTDYVTGIVTYIKTNKLQKHPYKHVIEEVLLNKGIVATDPSAEDIGNSDSSLEKKESLAESRLTYSPSSEKHENKKWPKDARTEEQKMKEPTPTVSISGTDLMKGEYASGMVNNPPTNSGAIENPKDTPEVRQEQPNRLREASKLLDTILAMRRSSRFNAPLWYLLGSVALAGAYAGFVKSKTGEADVPGATTISAPDAKKMNYSDWMAYMNWAKPQEMAMAKDMVSLTPQELVEKYVSSYVKPGDTVAGNNLLSRIDGDQVVSDQYANIAGLTPEQRNQLGVMITTAEKINQSMIAAGEEKMRTEKRLYSLGLTREIPVGGGQMKQDIRQFLEKIRKANNILKL